MGIIYIVENKDNHKVYIGKTTQPMEVRFRQHIQAAKLGIKNTKFYSAIREFGEDKFSCRKLEECPDSELNNREIYYISKYNSYKNGYNSTPGGENTYSKLSDIDFDQFKEDYLSDMSLIDIALKHGIVIQSAMKLCDKLQLKDKPYIPKNGTKAIPINYYDLHFNYIGTFDTVADALKHLEIKGFGYYYIKKAYTLGNIAYGYRWQKKEDLVFGKYQYNTIYDKYEHQVLGKDVGVDRFGMVRSKGMDYTKYVGESAAYKCSTCGRKFDGFKCPWCENKALKEAETAKKLEIYRY